MTLKKVPARNYNQYHRKPKFEAWLDIRHKTGEQIDEAADKVARSYDIDTAKGHALDVIGRIVDINRDFINHIELEQFQFGDDSEFGDENVCFSADSVAGDAQMSDDLFRLLIKAKILKNNREATIEDIIEQMTLLVDAYFVRINNPEDMTFSIEFAAELTPLQRYALFNENIIQVPQGVLFNGFTEITEYTEFGNDDYMFGAENSQFTTVGA